MMTAAEVAECISEIEANYQLIRQLRAERDRLRDRLAWLRAFREAGCRAPVRW
jgi:hypothetical protein